MSDENTVTRSLSELKKGKTDWKRLAEMPESEVEANAKADADAAPASSEEWDDARVVLPASSHRKPPHRPGAFD